MKKLMIIIILLLIVNVHASLQGDVNLDGKVNSLDFVLVKNHILGSKKLSGNNLTMADANNDKKVNSLDYVVIKNIILNGSKKVDVSGVIIDKTSASVVIGESITLKATVSPSDATNKTITWTSSDTSIATVDDTGKVTGKKSGTVTITAKSNNGKIATCTITIKSVAVTGISLNKTSLTLAAGKSETLTVTVSPSNAADKMVTWTSSDTSIATVDNTGKVTGKKSGTVTITAKSNNGKKATCTVTIEGSIVAVTGISLNKKRLILELGKSETLTATVSPSNATDKTVRWSSSNSHVATVDTTGKVTGKKAGTAAITAWSSDGKFASCKVMIPVNEMIHVGSYENDSGLIITQYNYYGSNGEKYVNKWHQEGDDKYYFGSDGISYGEKWLQYNNAWYYFRFDGKMVRNSAIKEYVRPTSNNPYRTFVYKYYVGEDGKRVSNQFVKLNEEQWGYAGADGVIIVSQWIKVNNKWYYAHDVGALYCDVTGNHAMRIDGKSYQFDSSCACINC